MAFTYIDTETGLRDLCTAFSTREWLAVDTEFVRVDTYYPKLCLVQLSDGQTHACVDVLAIPDLSALWALLLNPRIIKLLHAASQDYEIFVKHAGACPAPLFDTQTAATLAGLGDQIGYAGLIEKMLGIAVDKSLSRTDWSRRPLKPAELDYAAADVEHLATIYPRLNELLIAGGRLGWLAEDCARACEPAQYVTQPQDAWRRLKGMARLAPAEQQVAAVLAEWRETEAQQKNRPRKWIVEDDPIYRIAERQPRSEAELAALNALPPKTLARHSARLLELVETALAKPAVTLAVEVDLDGPQRQQMQRVQEQIRRTAAELNLPASYLAPKAEMFELVLKKDAADIALLKGWRRDVAGAAALKSISS